VHALRTVPPLAVASRKSSQPRALPASAWAPPVRPFATGRQRLHVGSGCAVGSWCKARSAAWRSSCVACSVACGRPAGAWPARALAAARAPPPLPPPPCGSVRARSSGWPAFAGAHQNPGFRAALRGRRRRGEPAAAGAAALRQGGAGPATNSRRCRLGGKHASFARRRQPRCVHPIPRRADRGADASCYAGLWGGQGERAGRAAQRALQVVPPGPAARVCALGRQRLMPR
jgi:hypothetical protein